MTNYAGGWWMVALIVFLALVAATPLIAALAKVQP